MRALQFERLLLNGSFSRKVAASERTVFVDDSAV